MTVTVAELVVADPPELWSDLGFVVDGENCEIGGLRIRLDPTAGKRLARWSIHGIGDDTAARMTAEGIATTVAADAEAADASAADANAAHAGAVDSRATHPNGAVAVDHVVAFSPDLDRTVAVLEQAGLDLRRIREEPTPAGAPRQAFFRLGDVILECIQLPDSPDLDRTRNARLWGLALVTDAMDATAAHLGDRLGEPRAAVQEGRTIATLRREAGSSVPIAFMTARPARSASR